MSCERIAAISAMEDEAGAEGVEAFEAEDALDFGSEEHPKILNNDRTTKVCFAIPSRLLRWAS